MSDHFWTLDVGGELLPKPPWRREGPACWVRLPGAPAIPGVIPFWRFYDDKSGCHFWTTDPNGEAWGGHREGPAAFVFGAATPETIPLYRFYSDKSGEHFWTTDKNGELLPKNEFHLEGPACYVYPSAMPSDQGVAPFWRFFCEPPAQRPPKPPITEPAPAQAELVFLETWTNPAFAMVGQSFTVFFRFGNVGAKTASSFTIRIEHAYDNNREYRDISVPPLSPGTGDNAFWTFPSGLQAGRHFFDAYIDVFNQVNEVSEFNNRATNAPVIRRP